MDKQIYEKNDEHPFLTITLILSENQCHKFVRIAKEKGIRGGIVILGKGTVKSAVLNLLGIKSQKREIVSFLIEKEKAKETLDHFTKELQLHEPGHGIAYIEPVIASRILNDKQGVRISIPESVKDMGEESMYKKLTVVVNRGMAEDVMDIARKSGVKGGTVMHGRGTGSEYTETLLGMEIEPEKELVVILMPSNLIEKVVNDLCRELHLDNPGNGIMFVEPILEVRGLLDPNRSSKET